MDDKCLFVCLFRPGCTHMDDKCLCVCLDLAAHTHMDDKCLFVCLFRPGRTHAQGWWILLGWCGGSQDCHHYLTRPKQSTQAVFQGMYTCIFKVLVPPLLTPLFPLTRSCRDLIPLDESPLTRSCPPWRDPLDQIPLTRSPWPDLDQILFPLTRSCPLYISEVSCAPCTSWYMCTCTTACISGHGVWGHLCTSSTSS